MSLSALEVIWRPPPDLAGKMPMDIYRQHINKKFSQSHKTIRDLHSWTVANQQPFWLDLYSYLELIPPLPAGVKRAYDESLPMSSIPPFFEGARTQLCRERPGERKAPSEEHRTYRITGGAGSGWASGEGHLACTERESPKS
jgi:hypothetical protein